MNVSPLVDIAFKKLFGVEENKDLLISLINSIISQEDQVADIELLNPYNPKNFRVDKLSILDIKARGINGRLYNIEMQITDEADYDKRALYYWAKLYSEQLKSGEDYASLSKAIGIHILNFYSIPNAEKYHNAFHITEKESGIKYFKDLELHTIELKKFNKEPKQGLNEVVGKVRTSLDRWVAFLTNSSLLKSSKLPKELDAPEVKKAIDVLEVMSFNEEERNAYEEHLKWLRIEANTLKKAEEKGYERGREEGIEKGIITTAKNMLMKGYSLEAVQDITGLTKEELTKLKSS